MSSVLPSLLWGRVDDVVDVASPETGEEGGGRIVKTKKLTYRWTNSATKC